MFSAKQINVLTKQMVLFIVRCYNGSQGRPPIGNVFGEKR